MKNFPVEKPSRSDLNGNFPASREITKLKWVCELKYGSSLSDENRIIGSIPVYGSNGIVGYHNMSITQKPVIIIGRKGSFGKINYSNEKCFPIDTTYYIDQTATRNNLRWLFYALNTLELDSISKDSAVPGLSREEAYKKLVVFPSLDEQKKIALFLDSETQKIDSLISKKQTLIDLLKEERAAIINQAVTKGIDPNVEMKDSGIEWLGRIPKHWRPVPLKKHLLSVVDYRGKTPTKREDGEIFLVTARNIKGGIINYTLSQEYISKDDYNQVMQRGKPIIGDVLFTTEAPLGEVASVDRDDIALAQRIIKFRANPEYLDNYYLKEWLSSQSFQNNLQSYATGSTALGIKASKLNFLKLLLPPLGEQKMILYYISEEKAKIDNSIVNIQKEIALLQEYRVRQEVVS